jgi:hypothetical protein
MPNSHRRVSDAGVTSRGDVLRRHCVAYSAHLFVQLVARRYEQPACCLTRPPRGRDLANGGATGFRGTSTSGLEESTLAHAHGERRATAPLCRHHFADDVPSSAVHHHERNSAAKDQNAVKRCAHAIVIKTAHIYRIDRRMPCRQSGTRAAVSRFATMCGPPHACPFWAA